MPLLTNLPESFGNLSSLKTFIAMTTMLKGLPDSFCNLKSLKCLDIQQCTIKKFHFPPNMKNLKKLREITLGCIDFVPDFVSYMKDLTKLDLSHNQLVTLPDFIGNFTKLKKLILHSTWIEELPDWIGNLKNLEDLDLSSNIFNRGYDEIMKEVESKLPNLFK